MQLAALNDEVIEHVGDRTAQRLGAIRYVARYIDPTGRERSKTFTRRADAQKYLTEIEAAKLRGTWVDPAHGRVRFAAWFKE